MPAPTGLKSGAFYSALAHDRLVADGLLASGECEHPSDLSELADLVFQKFQTQKPLTQRLPETLWRVATPNDGHLMAAALLVEGALRSVMTLNYDLAMQAALGRVSAGATVSIIRGPEDASKMSARSFVFLHRSVDSDEETWVMRKQALDTEWHDHWEEVVAGALLSAPVVIFTGLGSPAAVLTECVQRIANTGTSQFFYYDPLPENSFKAALTEHLAAEAMPMGWIELMVALSQRVVHQQLYELVQAAKDLQGERHETVVDCTSLVAQLEQRSIFALGSLRARWLAQDVDYLSDSSTVARERIADLVIAMRKLAEILSADLVVTPEGWVELQTPGEPLIRLLFAHGGGVRTVDMLAARIERHNSSQRYHTVPRHLVCAGVISSPTSAPIDLIRESDPDDLMRGADQQIRIELNDILLPQDVTSLRRRLVA